MKRITHLLLLPLLLLLASTQVQAQNTVEKYQALFISNFVKYITWPNNPPKITVGVLGNSRVLMALEEIATKQGSVIPITVIKVEAIDQVTRCDAIFVPESQYRNFSEIIAQAEGHNILIIAETDDKVNQGASIGFYEEGGKLRFAISITEAEKKELKVAGQLRSLAKLM